MSHRLKLLLVDDNPVDGQRLEQYLKQAKSMACVCEHAETGGEALNLCAEKPFDCLLLDMTLPDMSGLGVIEGLAKKGVEIPTIVLAVNPNEKEEEEVLKAGAYAWMPKTDMDAVRLERTIRYALDKADRLRKARAAEMQARTASRVKGEFISRVSGQVCKSIQTITWTAGMLQEKDPERLSYEQLSYLKRIEQESKSLMRDMRALLKLANIQSQSQELEVSSFLLQLVKGHQPLAKVHGLSLDLSVSNEVPETIMSDPEILRLILQTCLAYLLGFPSPGRVRMKVEQKQESQSLKALSVIMTYRGVSTPEHRDDALETKENSLAVTAEFARLLGGNLEVHTEPGVGLTINFTIPD